jgi:hypothetical protein
MAHDRLQRSIASVRLYHERWSVRTVILFILGKERSDRDRATLGALGSC